jgi:hypothetical protein
MDQGFRRGFTAAEKTELWDRWQRGGVVGRCGRMRKKNADAGKRPGPAARPLAAQSPWSTRVSAISLSLPSPCHSRKWDRCI